MDKAKDQLLRDLANLQSRLTALETGTQQTVEERLEYLEGKLEWLEMDINNIRAEILLLGEGEEEKTERGSY